MTRRVHHTAAPMARRGNILPMCPHDAWVNDELRRRRAGEVPVPGLLQRLLGRAL